MYEMAKKAREKMKAKARALAAPGTLESDQNTSSADWTPAEALNADAKTGMRPISKRAYKDGGKVAGSVTAPRADRKARKSGGRVETEIGVGMANKNMKEANKSREGVKHVGGFKKGGEVKDAGVKDKKALGAIDPSPKRGAAQNYKKGGRTKKADGGILDTIANALAGRGYIDGSTWMSKEEPVTASDTAAPTPPRRPASLGTRRRAAGVRLSPEQASREMAMAYENEKPVIRGSAAAPVQSDYFMKKGGKIKKAGGGSLPSSEESMRSAERLNEIKATEKKPARSSSSSKELPSAEEAAGRSGQFQNYKKGGRTAKATGGGLMSMLKGGKKVSKKAGKTDINIVINAGQKTPARAPAAGLMPPPGADAGLPPMPPPGIGAAPPAAPPMPPPGAGPMGGPDLPLPGRKAGGRITKVASSYKDMEAGAGGGEGRLQKTDIAKRGGSAPARKAGGRISKVAKSYKDMSAGAGSGEGRMQKTDIAKAKAGHGK